MKTVTLDNTYRTAGKDHLIEYRDSVFYQMLNKPAKQRGDAYEGVVSDILKAHFYTVEPNTRDRGIYDFLVDGRRVELKGSRKASPYDTRGRSWQYSMIMERPEGSVDYIILSCFHPDDTVELYKTTFDRLIPHLKWQNGGWNLTGHPTDFDTDHILTCKMV